jgi:hypothetical protein
VQQSKAPKSSSASTTDRITLSKLIENLPAVLSLAGILIYGAVAYGASIYYHLLGVDLSDVGMGYAAILTNAIGLVLLAVLLTAGAWFVETRIAGGNIEDQIEYRRRRLLTWMRYAMAALILGAVLGSPATVLFVKSDRAVGLMSVMPIIRVQPVTVRSAAKLGETPPDVQSILGHPSYYLGQSGGMAAFFDTTTQRAVYVPISLIIIEGRRPAKDIPLVEFLERLFD